MTFNSIKKEYQDKYGIPEVSFDEENDGLKIYIDTEKLHLSPVQSKDAENYHTLLYGDQEVMKTMADGRIQDLDYVKKRINGWEERPKKNNPFTAFKVEKNDTGAFIGHIVLGGSDESNSSEMAYMTAKKYQNQHLTSEAVGAIVCGYAPKIQDKGYKVPTTNGSQDFNRIIATALQEGNEPSNKILQKLGFKGYKISEKFGNMRNHYELSIVTSYEESFEAKGNVTEVGCTENIVAIPDFSQN